MKITELLKDDKPCISCELFPPKAGSELQNALKIVDKIAEIKPHFMSVTYGAGGTSAGQTVAIAKAVEEHNIPALAHLTCIDATGDGVIMASKTCWHCAETPLPTNRANLCMPVI